MSQVSPYLRKTSEGYAHWCCACEEMHSLPHSWKFNGDVNKPTFSPSFNHSGIKRNMVGGKWVGEGKDAWLYDSQGKPIPTVCHYILTDGVLHYCGDCTHSLSGQSVSLPRLPADYAD